MMQKDAHEAQVEPITGVVLEGDAAVVDAPDPHVEPIPSQPQSARNGFGGAVFGGLVAAMAGFALAQIVPNGWPLAATNSLTTQVAAQTAELAALQDQLAGAPKVLPTDPAVIDRLAALEGQPGFDPKVMQDRILSLESRLSAIEKMPADGSGAIAPAVAALQSDMQTLRDALVAVEKQAIAAETIGQASADDAAKIADDAQKSMRRLAAFGQLQAAFDTGAPYAPVLADLATETDPIAAVLADNADKGLPTVSALQASFPPAARLGLDAALRANMGESWAERATSFLRSQTGARSLEPREGSDPDAVLSRAEAALNIGDFAVVLTELEALPPEAQPALADWRALAETRLEAEKSIAALAATIGK